MGMMDAFKSAVMKDGSSKAKTSATPTTVVPPSASSGLMFPSLAGVGSLQSAPAVQTVVSQTAQVDPKFYETLVSAMNAVPTPGLQEFLLVTDGLAADIPQPKLFQVALNVVGKKGITQAQVAGEINKRLAALESENSQLLGMADRQYTVDVGGKENEVATVDQQISSVDQQIASLQDKKGQLQARRAELQAEVLVKRQNIENKKSGLTAAYEKLKQEMALLQARVSS